MREVPNGSLSQEAISRWNCDILSGHLRDRKYGGGQKSEPAVDRATVRMFGRSWTGPVFELDVDGSSSSSGVAAAAILWRTKDGVLNHSAGTINDIKRFELEALILGAERFARDCEGCGLRVWTDCATTLHFLSDPVASGRLHRLSKWLRRLQVEWVPRDCLVEVDLLAQRTRMGAVCEVPKKVSFGVDERLFVRRCKIRRKVARGS